MSARLMSTFVLAVAACGPIPEKPCTHCPNIAGVYVQASYLWAPGALTCITTPPGYPGNATVTQNQSNISIDTGLSTTPLTGTLNEDLSVSLNTTTISSLLPGVALGPLSLTGSFKVVPSHPTTFSGTYTFTADSSCKDTGAADWTHN